MRRLKINDGQDLWKESYEFLFEGIIQEFRETILSLIETNNSYGGILKGFDLSLDSDPTKLKIEHNTSTGYGAVIDKRGQLVFTSTGTYNIELVDYNQSNLVFVKYSEVEGYPQFNQVTNTYQNTRIYNNYEVKVYTETQYNNLTESEKEQLVLLGRALGQGSGNPPVLDLSVRVYLGMLIKKAQITEDMLSPFFRIYQYVVRQSISYNDHYIGIPQNLEDDLNELRSKIREIQGTLNYRDPAPGTLLNFDDDLNDLHGEGVFKGVWNEFLLETSTGFNIVIKSGKALVAKKVVRLQTSTGLIVEESSKFNVGDWDNKTDFEELTFGAQPDTQYLNHDDIVNGSLHMTDINNVELQEGIDYGVDYNTGAITSIVGGDIANETVRCYYQYSLPRIDIVQINKDGQLSIKKGDAQDNPIEPEPDNENIKLWVIKVNENVNGIIDDNIIDRRLYLDNIQKMKRDLQEYSFDLNENTKTTLGNRLSKAEKAITDLYIRDDYRSANQYYQDPFIENFLTRENQDTSIEDNIIELAEVREQTTEQFDPKTYRYRDSINKKELKEGVLFNQRKYYWGQFVEYWSYKGTNYNGDLKYDKWRNCFWGVNDTTHLSYGAGTLYKFKLDNNTGKINIVSWWKFYAVDTDNKALRGITVTETDLYLLTNNYTTLETTIYRIPLSNLPESGNEITSGMVASDSGVLGRILIGLDFNGVYIVTNNRYDKKIEFFDKITLAYQTGQDKDVSNLIIHTDLIGIAYDENGDKIYLIDYKNGGGNSHTYIFDNSYNCIGLLENRTEISNYITYYKGDIIIRNGNNKLLDKYKIKNTVKLLGQIKEWKHSQDSIYGLDWDETNNCWWVTKGESDKIYKYGENWNLLATYTISPALNLLVGIDSDGTYLYVGNQDNTDNSPAVIRIAISNLSSSTSYDVLVRNYVPGNSNDIKQVTDINLGEGNDLYVSFAYPPETRGIFKIDKTDTSGNYININQLEVKVENGIRWYTGIYYRDKILYLIENYSSNDYTNRIIKVDLTKDNTSNPQIIEKFNTLNFSDGSNHESFITIAEKNNELIFNCRHYRTIAKLALNTQSDEDNWLYFFNSNTSPVKLLSDNVYSIAYGERYYSPDEYVDKTYVLPEKFIVVGSDAGIDIIDITNPRNPIKFIDFIENNVSSDISDSSNNVLFRYKPPYKEDIKIHKDVIYFGTANYGIGILSIDFKNNEIKILSEHGFYKYNGGIRERNSGAGYSSVDTSFKLFRDDVFSLYVKEIDNNIYIASTHLFQGGVSLTNLTKRTSYCWAIEAGGTKTLAVYISDDNKLYISKPEADNNSNNPHSAGIHVIGDITKIYRDCNDDTNAGDSNNYWTIDTGYGKHYSTSSFPALVNNYVNDIKVVSEYDIHGNWKTNKIYVVGGQVSSTDLAILSLIDENNNEIKTIYNNLSPTGWENISIQDDQIISSYDDGGTSDFANLWVFKKGKFDYNNFVLNKYTYPLKHNVGYLKNILLINNIVFYCGISVSGSNSSFGYILLNPYHKDSYYQSKEIDLEWDTKRLSYIMSEKKTKGYKTTIIDDNDNNFTYTGTGWDTSNNNVEDYNKTIHRTNNHGDTITYTIPDNIRKVGLITRFGNGYGDIKITITDSNGNITRIINLNESSTDYRRVVWITNNLTIGETHTITIEKNTNDTKYIYFDALILSEELSDETIDVQFSHDNGITRYNISEDNELEIIKEEFFSGNNSDIEFTMINPSSDIKEVWVDEGSGFVEKLEGIDWQHDEPNNPQITAKTITFINNYVPPAGTDNIKIVYYPVCTKGLIKIQMKQPQNNVGDYDEFVESYITDFGIYTNTE